MFNTHSLSAVERGNPTGDSAESGAAVPELRNPGALTSEMLQSRVPAAGHRGSNTGVAMRAGGVIRVASGVSRASREEIRCHRGQRLARPARGANQGLPSNSTWAVG